MFVASSVLTLFGLMALATAAVAAYLFIPRRPPSAKHRKPRAVQATQAAPPPGSPGAPHAGEALPPVAPSPQARLTLRAVVERMANVGDEETTFFDPTTNRLITLGDVMLALLESDDPLMDEPVDYSQHELEDFRRKLKAKTFVTLPTKGEINEFKYQERFCDGLPEGEAKDQMLKVMLGQTGFRSFDGAVKRLGIEEDWHRLRDAEFARIAVAWLEKNGISCERDMPMPDEPDQPLRQAS
ncbi:MAG: hypothetical protein ACYSU7_13835 [Planctomycetota bacterium]|jgi:hypothetical protein